MVTALRYVGCVEGGLWCWVLTNSLISLFSEDYINKKTLKN